MDTRVAIVGNQVTTGNKPFVLYTIRVSTNTSHLDVTKRFSQFVEFHRQLCYFCHEPVGKDWDLVELIPKLPSQWVWNNLNSDVVKVPLT